MKPIREMAKLVLEAAAYGNDPARQSSEDYRRGVAVGVGGSRNESRGGVRRATTLSRPGGLFSSCKSLGRTCTRVGLQGLSMTLKVGLERDGEGGRCMRLVN